MIDMMHREAVRIIHAATICIRNEYPELRAGDASGAARIEFWNELVHRCAGFLVRGAELPAGFVEEAEAQARQLQIGEWREFRKRIERTT